jgi:hypothetical protein
LKFEGQNLKRITALQWDVSSLFIVHYYEFHCF